MSCPETSRTLRAARRTEALAQVVLERFERMTAQEAALPGGDTSRVEDLQPLVEALYGSAMATVLEAMGMADEAEQPLL